MHTHDITIGMGNSFSGRSIKSNMPSSIREIPRNYGRPGVLPDVSRLFVCVGHRNGISQWAELTSRYRKRRLALAEIWRTWQDGDSSHSPTVRWKKDVQYLNGAVFEGPDALWAALATDRNPSGKLKIVTPAGLAVIRRHLQLGLKENLIPLV